MGESSRCWAFGTRFTRKAARLAHLAFICQDFEGVELTLDHAFSRFQLDSSRFCQVAARFGGDRLLRAKLAKLAQEPALAMKG